MLPRTNSLFHDAFAESDLLQSLDRCAALDDTLSRLARTYPATKFLRARAGAIGFATSRNATSTRSTHLAPFPITRRPSRQILVPGRYPRDGDDDDDPYGDDDGDDSGGEEDADDGWEDDNVDTDVLPTLLAYRGGLLEHTWVRVDWEAKSGIEDLLRRCVKCCFATFPSRQELTMAMDPYRYGILHGADPRRGVAHVNGSLSDDDDIDDGELVFGGSDDEM